MNDLLAARSQMAMSLAFHIIFAAIGIAMPLLMIIAEWKWLRTKDSIYLTLAQRWAKGPAILFAVGAVSGTVLSFELGLLWPGFMGYAGSIIGMPFSLEGFAFFTEAIFLGIYLYGWKRVPPRAHLFAGVMVAVSGVLSGIFVVIANAWMNTPVGFRLVDGKPVDIDPIAAMMNPAAFSQTLHMTLAAYAATGFVVAGIHAFMLRRDPDNRFHRAALANLESVVLTGEFPVTVLEGPAGAGKSTLAIALAHDEAVRRRFPDGVIWFAAGEEGDLLYQQAVFLDTRRHPVDESDEALSGSAGVEEAMGRVLTGGAYLVIVDDARVWDGPWPRVWRVRVHPPRKWRPEPPPADWALVFTRLFEGPAATRLLVTEYQRVTPGAPAIPHTR
jgi:hypothetical protein